MSVKVAWLPAHPADGSESMLRYWQALRRWARPGDGSLEIVEAFGPPPPRAARAGGLRRAWCKRVWYPSRVRRLGRAANKGEVFHLLDHGFAHLLPHLPADAKIVATVHDLAPLEADEGLSPAQVRRFAASLTQLARASRVVVPSHFTARQVVERLRLPAERVVVLPMGVDLEQFQPVAPVRPGPYVLSVGSCAPRKNLAVLPALMRAVAASVLGVTLVRVGEPLPAPLRAELSAALSGRVVELGWIDAPTLAACYSGALALVQPSRLEGFGLPVLEAMACGCPVVSSRSSSLPEVGGGVALYFDADAPLEGAARLCEIAAPTAFRRDVVARGLARAQLFSWAAHATALQALYRDVAKG